MTEIARRPAGALAVQPTQTDWTPDQRAALDSLGIDDTATAGDLRVFLTYAQRTGLDPFARQIYLIGRNAKENINGKWSWRKRYSIQVGIDGFRVIAARSGKFRGMTPTQWCGPDGVWRDVWLDPEPPAAARVGVLHADFAAPLQSVAVFDEYAPRKDDGTLSGLWPKMPALMIAKVAEALALRQAFPNDLSGIYVAEEMDQAPPRVTGPAAPPRLPAEVLADVLAAVGEDQLRALWRECADAGTLDATATDESTGVTGSLREHLQDAARALTTPPQDDVPVVVDVQLPADDPLAPGGSDADPWATPAAGASDE